MKWSSGGDMLPICLRCERLAHWLVQQRGEDLLEWDVPSLIDGGTITAPRGGFYNIKGEWDIENKGISQILW
jgi:tricorn protease